MNLIDLRSDTVTIPSDGMREAMARAPVGDDQYGEDPTVNLLQERFAALAGKQQALFLPSGTMANQVALRVLTRPGDEVIAGGEAHILWHESGAAAVNGVQINAVGNGLLTAADVVAAHKPRGHAVYPPTTLVTIENTHNRGGGLVFPVPRLREVFEVAHRLKMGVYLDGARLFNAAIVSRVSVGDLSARADMVSISLSKGLGCPIGSMLMGGSDEITAARRFRRQMGGAMRQAGIVAAAGLYALDHNVERLAQDHASAKVFAEIVAGARGCLLDANSVETNIVVFRLSNDGPTAADVVEAARRRNVLLAAFGTRTVRAVTHLNVTREQCREAAAIVAEIIERPDWKNRAAT